MISRHNLFLTKHFLRKWGVSWYMNYKLKFIFIRLIQILPETWINLELKWWFAGTVHIPQKNPVRGGKGFVTNELPFAIQIYPLHQNTDANFDKFTKKWDLKVQSMNEDLKAQFVRHKTSWGSFWYINYQFILILIFIRFIQKRRKFWTN